jgi:OmpA-OmpF porin, OOP family
MEYVPGGQYFFYHKELPASKRAIEAARSAGKDKACPAEFQAAEKLMKDAYALYYACHTKEAIAKANEAIAAANALCPQKPTPVPAPTATPAPAPPAPEAVSAAPTASLSAASASIEQGACTNLTWSTTNARSVSIDPGIGPVDTSGSRQVCPSSTTRYTLTATGAGGSRTDSTTVGVTPKRPTDKLTIHVNFDTAKSNIRKGDVADLRKAEEFVRKYQTCKIEIDGYTDSRGSVEYNLGLSERRADAVKAYLIEHGATAADQITTRGFGKSNPIGDNKTKQGQFENRRAEILIFCQ